MTLQKYTEKDYLDQYEEKAKVHRQVPFRKIIELIEPKDKKILDLGCGTGDLDEMLIAAGANVCAIDKSGEMIEICKSRYQNLAGVNFQVMDGAKIEFPDNSFDAVVCNMVLLNVEELEDVQKIIREVAKVLKPGGLFVFSELHPICLMNPVRNRYTKFSPDFSYYQDGEFFVAGVNQSDGKALEFKNCHWTLETYSKILEESGLLISRISEPTYGDDAPDLYKNYPIPEYILFACRKI